MNGRVNVGIVGAGGIFLAAHFRRGYLHVPEARITALCDISEPALRRADKSVKEGFEKRIAELKEAGDADTAAIVSRAPQRPSPGAQDLGGLAGDDGDARGQGVHTMGDVGPDRG